MGFLNLFSKTRTNDHSEISATRVSDFTKTYEELKPFFSLLVYYFKYVIASEKEVVRKVKEIQTKTGQSLNEDELFKELWIFRFICLHMWFFDLMSPKNETELSDELLVINSALKTVLQENHRLEYLLWLRNGLSDFIVDELDLKKMDEFKNNFSSDIAEKVTTAAFKCTDGRLAGELHDFVIELFMTTMQQDRKVFDMEDGDDLSEVESTSIENLITELNENTENETSEMLKDFVETESEDIEQANEVNPNRTGRFCEYSKTMGREAAIDVFKMWLLHVRYYHPKLDVLFHGVSIPTFFLPVPMELLQETPEIIKEFTDENSLVWSVQSMEENLGKYANRYYPRTGDDEEIIRGLADAISDENSLELIFQRVKENKGDWYFEYKEL